MKLSQLTQLLSQYAVSTVIVFTIVGCGGESGGTESKPQSQNVAPVIDSLIATPDEAFNGETLAILATATDSDNDNLTYDFSTNLGDISETGGSASVVCEDGLTTINLLVTDGRGGDVSGSIGVTCNIVADKIADKIADNLGLTNLVEGGSVSGEEIDFTGTTVDGTVLAIAYDSPVDFSNHNDVTARGISGTAQRVLSIARTTDNSSLPTTFPPAQDLMIITSTSNNQAVNSMLQSNGGGDASDICVSITANETSDGNIDNINQTGSYTFQGRDLIASTLNFEYGQYVFALSDNGSVDLSTLANQVYANIGAGVEVLLNGKEMNSDNVLNDVCDTKVLINPFTNTVPEIFIDSVVYSATLADGITARDIGGVSISFTSTDVNESAATLTTVGTISSALLNVSTDLTSNNGKLEGSLLSLAGASDAVISLSVTDSDGGSDDAPQSIGIVDLNDAPVCSPVSLTQDYANGDSNGTVELIDSKNCLDGEGDSFSLENNLLDTNVEGSYSQTVRVKDSFNSISHYTITGTISTPASSFDYVLAPLTFNISFAVDSCSNYSDGSYTLATWKTNADLASIVSLCGTQSAPCFTQYKVESGQHISVIDGSLMPPYFGFWQGTPLYTVGKSVMVRNDISFLFEQQAAGYPVCGKKVN